MVAHKTAAADIVVGKCGVGVADKADAVVPDSAAAADDIAAADTAADIAAAADTADIAAADIEGGAVVDIEGDAVVDIAVVDKTVVPAAAADNYY